MTFDHAAPVAARPAGPAATPVDEHAAAAAQPHRPVPVPGLALPRAEPVIRRLVSVRGRPGSDGTSLEQPAPTALDAEAEELIAAVDAKTGQAWGQVIKQPLFSQLSALANADGHISLWTEGVRDLMRTGSYPGLAAAEFGYAVESLCTHLLGASAAGWSLEYQVAAGRTRPDIVARKATRTIWLDLTAGSTVSHGHIYTSKNWQFGNVCPWPHAEITYPVLDFATLGVIKKNAVLEDAGKPIASDVDPAALNAEVAAAQKLLAARLENWKTRFPPAIRENVRTVRDYGTILADRDTPARAGFIGWLNDTFGTALQAGNVQDLRTAGSVLAALDMPPQTFGFVSTTTSKASGVAFLQSNDPNLLQPPTTS
jgi:hypothetical protein